MLGIYTTAKSEAGYVPTYFLNMLNERGGLATANHLLNQKNLSDGFTALYEKGRLDLTVEALVVKPLWRPLFSEDQIAIAEKRLRDLGYEF